MLPSGPRATVPGRPLAPARRSRISWGWTASPFTKCTGCCGSIRICFPNRPSALPSGRTGTPRSSNSTRSSKRKGCPGSEISVLGRLSDSIGMVSEVDWNRRPISLESADSIGVRIKLSEASKITPPMREYRQRSHLGIRRWLLFTFQQPLPSRSNGYAWRSLLLTDRDVSGCQRQQKKGCLAPQREQLGQRAKLALAHVTCAQVGAHLDINLLSLGTRREKIHFTSCFRPHVRNLAGPAFEFDQYGCLQRVTEIRFSTSIKGWYQPLVHRIHFARVHLAFAF